jgi:hypothetical protein
VLQFVIVKPLMAAGTLTVYTVNHHEMLSWWSTTASIVYNLSYTVALYGLVSEDTLSRHVVHGRHPAFCLPRKGRKV